jgi:hypothetical protein
MSRMSDKERSSGPTPDELHERFRAALDRKNGRHQSGAAGGAEAGGKASASTANTKRHREFRRKSGG